MTQEEAIKILSESIHYDLKVPWDKIVEAVHLSIEALSNPPLPSNLDEAAEEAALRAYPEKMGMFHEADIHYEADLNKAARIKYIEGYEQAEKDYIELAQLWVDSGNVNIMSFKRFLKTKLEEE